MNTLKPEDTTQSHSMDTHQLLKLYAVGKRDFHGMLLTGVDLSGVYLLDFGLKK